MVTGGAGFIGSHVVRKLLVLGFKVVVLDNLSGGSLVNLPKSIHFFKGDVSNAKTVERVFQQHKFDYVYHLAAYAAEGLSHFIKRFNYTNNVIGSVNIINECIKNDIKCLVFTSSAAVYGGIKPPFKESHYASPEDSYGIAKYAVELELIHSKRMFDLNYINFRPHNVYGEMQNIWDRYRNVVGIFMNQLMQNQPLTVFGDGNQTRAFSYVGDVSSIIAQSPLHKDLYNETFNIGGNDVLSINDLIGLLEKIADQKLKIKKVQARNEVRHAYASHKKLSQYPISRFKPTSPEEGLRKMFEWAKQVGPKKPTIFKNIELYKNLPPVWRNVSEKK